MLLSQALHIHGDPCVGCANVTITSDGALRKSAECSSAAWAIFSSNGYHIRLCFGGAMFFDHALQSLNAELNALELCVGAFLKLSLEFSNVAPHRTNIETIVSELQLNGLCSSASANRRGAR